MKKYILLLIVCISQAFSQTGGRSISPSYLNTLVTVTNYTATSDDSTNYYTGIGGYSDLGFIVYSTDSCVVDLYIISRNSLYNTLSATVTDSLNTTTNAGSYVNIDIKTRASNNIFDRDEVQIGYVFRATGQGTTTGRSFKILMYGRRDLYTSTTLVKTITNYTATSDDTSANYYDISNCYEAGIFIVTTDSVSVDNHLIGKTNGYLTNTTTYSPSQFVVTSNGGGAVNLPFRYAGLDRFINQDLLRVGSVFSSSGQGTTAGRTYKIYLYKTKFTKF